MSIVSKRDRIIPWYFVMFFGVIAAVNAVMVTLAVRTNTGLVTDHPYERGLAYNQVIEQETKQEALGWKSSIDLHGNTLHATITDAQGAIIVPDEMHIHFSRPAQNNMDFDVTLKNGAANVDFPANGVWNLRLYATKGDIQYQQAKRVLK